MSNKVSIRQEVTEDIDEIRNVVELAFQQSEFGHNGEADLVAELRRTAGHLSLVGCETGKVAAHIMFSVATMRTPDKELAGMGLAPISVLPSKQRQGIGAALIQFGINRLFEQGTPFVVVLGHPDYYSRFGFLQASEHAFRHGFSGLAQDLFLIRFNPTFGHLSSEDGIVYYDAAFGPQHENEG